jgi:hypothetical protein
MMAPMTIQMMNATSRLPWATLTCMSVSVLASSLKGPAPVSVPPLAAKSDGKVSPSPRVNLIQANAHITRAAEAGEQRPIPAALEAPR